MTSLPEDNLSNPFASPGVATTSEQFAAAVGYSLQQYATVRTGLKMIYYSIATLAAIVILGIIFSFIGVSNGPEMVAARLVVMAVGIAALVAMLMLIVGFCMTLGTPRSDEKTLAIISVVCFFVSIGLFLLSTFLLGGMGAVFLSLGTNLLNVVSTILFCLFLKRVGRNISSSRLEKSARSTLVWYGIFFVVCIVGAAMMWLSFASVSPSPNAGRGVPSTLTWLPLIFGLVMVVVALTTLFKYLAMLRTGIDELAPR